MFIARVESENGAQGNHANQLATTHDRRDRRNMKMMTSKRADLMYGHRGTNEAVHYLSPYEFHMLWDLRLLSFPVRLEDISNPKHHVQMTESGVAKLEARAVPGRHGRAEELIPRTD